MKINGPKGTQPVQLPQADRKGPQGGGPRSGGGRADRVDMSNAAQAMLRAREPEQPDVSRIAKLRSAVEDGSFRIDPQRIAQKMLQEER